MILNRTENISNPALHGIYKLVCYNKENISSGPYFRRLFNDTKWII